MLEYFTQVFVFICELQEFPDIPLPERSAITGVQPDRLFIQIAFCAMLVGVGLAMIALLILMIRTAMLLFQPAPVALSVKTIAMQRRLTVIVLLQAGFLLSNFQGLLFTLLYCAPTFCVFLFYMIKLRSYSKRIQEE